jgi:hypothetical protein
MNNHTDRLNPSSPPHTAPPPQKKLHTTNQAPPPPRRRARQQRGPPPPPRLPDQRRLPPLPPRRCLPSGLAFTAAAAVRPFVPPARLAQDGAAAALAAGGCVCVCACVCVCVCVCARGKREMPKKGSTRYGSYSLTRLTTITTTTITTEPPTNATGRHRGRALPRPLLPGAPTDRRTGHRRRRPPFEQCVQQWWRGASPAEQPRRRWVWLCGGSAGGERGRGVGCFSPRPRAAAAAGGAAAAAAAAAGVVRPERWRGSFLGSCGGGGAGAGGDPAAAAAAAAGGCKHGVAVVIWQSLLVRDIGWWWGVFTGLNQSKMSEKQKDFACGLSLAS